MFTDAAKTRAKDDGEGEARRIMVYHSAKSTRLGRRQRRTRRGSVLVEAALVLPLVLLFFLCIIEYSRFLMTEHVLNNAARAGAIYAAKHTDAIVIDNSAGTAVTYGGAVADIQNIVASDVAGLSLSNSAINVTAGTNAAGPSSGTWTSGTPAGTFVCVQITGTYNFMIPLMFGLPSSLTWSSTNTPFQSVQPSEGN